MTLATGLRRNNGSCEAEVEVEMLLSKTTTALLKAAQQNEQEDNQLQNPETLFQL